MTDKNRKLQEKSNEGEFYAFLSQTADLWAKNRPDSQKQDWIKYMSDLSRSEQLIEKVIDFFKPSKQQKKKALDVGCGFGNLLLVLQEEFTQVCGIDIGPKSVEWSKKRAIGAEVMNANATEIPWPDREFDLVTATDVFEHIPYPEQEKAASEMMRVLKLGGYGYVEVPNRLQIRDEHNSLWFGTWLPDKLRKKYAKIAYKNGAYVQCWERTRRGWRKLFESQGFIVTIKPRYLKGLNSLKYFLIPPNRYHIYLTKP